MAMVCPQCNASHEQRLQCPRCDARLVFKETGAESSSRARPGSWQQTAWGRILIGLMLAQGIYHGLRHLCVAGLLASEGSQPIDVWNSLSGFVLLQTLQIIALLIGGVLAGAGQRQGVLHGAVLGVWNGVLVLLVQPEQPEELNALPMYALPLFQSILGALAGWIGSRIWQPLTPAIAPGASRQLLKAVRKQHKNVFAGPVFWTRVIVGACLAVSGALSAGKFLDRMIWLSDYMLTPESQLHKQVVTWEISALAILAGGMLAGASMKNGAKQGLACGLVTAVILVGIRLATPDPPSFFELAASMFGPVILGIMGGAFGSQLLPPLAPRPRRRNLDAA